jgi:hypothetical protein
MNPQIVIASFTSSIKGQIYTLLMYKDLYNEELPFFELKLTKKQFFALKLLGIKCWKL